MLSIEISQTSSVEALLASFTPAIDAAIETALDKSAAAILNRLRTTYMAEQDPSGAAWLPSEAARRRRAKGGTGTLFDTGRMFRSIQLSRSERGLRAIGTDVPYAPFHHLGQGQETREFLSLTPEHEGMAMSIFEAEVSRALGGLT